ncbi:MAG: hypothetical protein QW535_01030 [Candidatus Nezhaarchaeales archaeon]
MKSGGPLEIFSLTRYSKILLKAEGEAMTPRGLKILAIISALSVLLFYSCLSTYMSNLLRSEVAILKGRLQELEAQYEDLSKRHEALSASYIDLQGRYSTLLDSFEKLTSEHLELKDAYAMLNKTYTELLQNYTILQQQLQDYLNLQERYEVLLSEHQALSASYAKLKEAYDKMHFALFSPLLLNETVRPTINDLKRWLAEDDTDKIPYSKWDFVCGDYALMLSVKAKMNHWDVGIVVVLGRDAQGREFNHAFNAIRCVEGLVYIEPQNDQVFYASIKEGSWYYHPGFGQIYVETFVIVVPYEM